MANSVQRQLIQEQAWVGDAVLLLYARLRVLREEGTIDGEKCIRMTSNQFLSAAGEPTSVEARIGRAFGEEGLEGAFRFIETQLMPAFEKQEHNRIKGAAIRPGSAPGTQNPPRGR